MPRIASLQRERISTLRAYHQISLKCKIHSKQSDPTLRILGCSVTHAAALSFPPSAAHWENNTCLEDNCNAVYNVGK
eukprot:2930253-Amphidinium_carterae.1